MNLTALAFPALILILVSSVTLLASQDWRIGIAALGLQYLGVFVLVALGDELGMCV